MSFVKISDSIRESANKLIEVINAHLDYYQIVAFDKLVTLLTKSISNAIVGFTAFMMVFFSSLALAQFIGELFEHISVGFLIVALIYGIGGWVVWLNRVKWIVDPIIAALTETIEETSYDLGLENETENELNSENV
ncbi:MAG: phage holin family protein [Salibacteraceae bacterium]